MGFSKKGKERGKNAPSPKDIFLEKKTAPLPKSHLIEKGAVLTVPSELQHGTRLSIGHSLALVCFGLLYLDIQKTNSALLRVCETQTHFNNMASPYENFTPAMYEYTVSKYCVAVVLCAL